MNSLIASGPADSLARQSVPSKLARLRKDCDNRFIVTGATMPSTADDRQRSATIARALSDPKRLCVLETLASGERSVSELSRDAGCQIPNMSQHLSVLRAAGIVATRREGTTVYYRLADQRVLEAYRLIQNIAR
ncbi:MAG TPA: metalloregulator ArsR/SmtB family transcription factor [Candidatus Limnocylindria bacterium]|jgi:DNA-binding transcriptional ArsR family regulator|nr:metalloregulator ArsR/SmtB family transcription factor [Candidatus Limnocylindria bacterium]